MYNGEIIGFRRPLQTEKRISLRALSSRSLGLVGGRDPGMPPGEQKEKFVILLRGSNVGCPSGIRKAFEHAVDLEARPLYKAVGLAIERFRRCEHVKHHPKGPQELVVESREPGTQHRLTRNTFDTWLRRFGGSSADVALKTRLKSLLGAAP